MFGQSCKHPISYPTLSQNATKLSVNLPSMHLRFFDAPSTYDVDNPNGRQTDRQMADERCRRCCCENRVWVGFLPLYVEHGTRTHDWTDSLWSRERVAADIYQAYRYNWTSLSTRWHDGCLELLRLFHAPKHDVNLSAVTCEWRDMVYRRDLTTKIFVEV